MYRLTTGAHCGHLKELRPPAADSFSDSMPAEAATVFSRDKGDRRYTKSAGQQAPNRRAANPGGGELRPLGCRPLNCKFGKPFSTRMPQNLHHTKSPWTPLTYTTLKPKHSYIPLTYTKLKPKQPCISLTYTKLKPKQPCKPLTFTKL